MLKQHSLSTKTNKSNTQSPVKREVGIVDNPYKQKPSVSILLNIMNRFTAIREKYGLKQEGINALLLICDNWSNGKPSTAYSLSSKPNKDDLTAWNYKLSRLSSRGFIEPCGNGNNGCNVWAPTNLGQSVVKWLIEGEIPAIN